MNFGKAAMGALPGLMGGMGGGSPGGFNPRGSGASPFSQAQQGMGMLGGGMGTGPGAMAAGALLSDEHSKTRITELEDELQRTYAALGGKASTADVRPTQPEMPTLEREAFDPIASGRGVRTMQPYEPRASGSQANDRNFGFDPLADDRNQDLDAAYRKPTSNGYDYKDPSAPGAAPGRQAGPMADELKGLPGVVTPGADGMDRVDTGRLTMTNTSEIANLRREMDALMGRIGSGQSNPDGTY